MIFDSSNATAETNSRLITVLQNANGHLIAEQRPQTGNFIVVLGLSLAIIFALVQAYKHQWKMILIPVLASLILIPMWHSSKNPIYRIVVDQQAHEVVSDKLVDGKSVEHTVTPVGEIASAEMQFNRGARTIVMIGRDGKQIFPLGEQQLQNEPDQYVVLNAIREAIGQAPATPQ
jgi:hypothetical protein